MVKSHQKVQGNLIPQGELKDVLAWTYEEGTQEVQGNLIPQGELKGHGTDRRTPAWAVQGNLIPQGELKVMQMCSCNLAGYAVQGNLIPQGELKDQVGFGGISLGDSPRKSNSPRGIERIEPRPRCSQQLLSKEI